MCLENISGIITEQSRLYRLWINNKIKSREMTSGIFALREIRASVEARPPEPEVQAPASFTVISIPPDYRYRPGDGRFEPAPLTLEHEPNLAIESPRVDVAAEPEPELVSRSPQEARLFDELRSLSRDELLRRAKQAGLVDADEE